MNVCTSLLLFTLNNQALRPPNLSCELGLSSGSPSLKKKKDLPLADASPPKLKISRTPLPEKGGTALCRQKAIMTQAKRSTDTAHGYSSKAHQKEISTSGKKGWAEGPLDRQPWSVNGVHLTDHARPCFVHFKR
jgi:hypothetical protein